MNGAQCLVRALEREGVEIVFGYPGGAILPVYDALVDAKIRHILVRHEQGAALAADGFARATGKVGVCIATSGPGATNLVTGIANAYMDSVPIVAITGQVPTPLIGTDAFQEVDIFGITLPIVKHSFLVRDVLELEETVHEAFRIAETGRRGPVVIDLPKNVANTEVNPARGCKKLREKPAPPSSAAIERALGLLRASRRPIVYVGGGIRWGDAVEEFRAFVAATRIPVVSTLMGLGAFPTKDPLFLGMLGMHGLKAANLAIQASDLLVAAGVRFDDRATGKLAEFAPHAKVIHLDADAAEVGKLRRPEAPVVGDLAPALRALAIPLEQIEPWREECLANKSQHAWNYNAPTTSIYAPRLLKALSEAAGDEAIFVCDVGQHQMWVAQHCYFRRPDQHLSSGGLGTMGYGLPAAIGAQLGRPEARVINVTGDGSILMNVQELATLRRCNLPVKIVLIDNSALGMVRQWQELFFSRRYSEVDLSDNPDFVRLSESFGIPAFRLEREGDAPEAFDRLFGEEGPMLLHVPIEQEANVWPLVPPGGSNSAMLEGAHK